MKYAACIDSNGKTYLAALSPDGKRLCPLSDLGFRYADMIELISGYTAELHADIESAAAMGGGIPLEQVTLSAPIPHPKHDITCIGQNYHAHALEAARFRGVAYKEAAHPVYFSKRVNKAVPPGGQVMSHGDITSKLDYEVELAVVIGKRCDHIRPEEVFDHIFGYTIVNDVSARDLQYAHSQYTFGKGLDGCTPMGPWIVTADEFTAPPCLRLSTTVNGELRQDSNTSDFIFDIPYLISELSGGIALEPGDILITGTPPGVGMGFDPPRFLKPGDEVVCEIEGIGVLRNTIQ